MYVEICINHKGPFHTNTTPQRCSTPQQPTTELKRLVKDTRQAQQLSVGQGQDPPLQPSRKAQQLHSQNSGPEQAFDKQRPSSSKFEKRHSANIDTWSS